MTNKMMVCKTPWRNGSASDYRSEGCVLESGPGQRNSFNIAVMMSSNLTGGCWGDF